jgi:hypothetical protein
MKLDPGMHIGLHLVFFGKTGVTRLLWTFWRFYSKGGECETKASLWLKPTSGFKDMRPKGENVNMKIKKGEV